VDFVEGLNVEGAVTSRERILKERRIGPYTSSQKIVLVGEGDFSFSASLACAFSSAANIIATSLDSHGKKASISTQSSSFQNAL